MLGYLDDLAHQRVLTWSLGAALLMCCSPRDEVGKNRPSQSTVPGVTLLDSLQLEVPDSAALGRFSYITADEGGGVLVSDVGRGRLLRYGRDGRLRQVIGRYGGGPGEFMGTSVARTLQDGRVLAVMDPKRQYMSFLRADFGDFLSGLSMPFVEPGQTWTEVGNSVVFGVEGAPMLFGRLDLRDSTFMPLGHMPGYLLQNLFLVLSYGRVEVLPNGEDYIAMIPTVPGLQLLNAAGAPVGMVDVPVRHRRGNPQDLIEQQSKIVGPMRLLGSVDGALTRLQDGAIAVLNMDLTFADAMPPSLTGTKYYVSVLSQDLQRACVDLPVPQDSTTTGPLPVFAQGYLLITDEHIEGDSVRTVVYRYAVTTDGCNWVETGGIRPSPLTEMSARAEKH